MAATATISALPPASAPTFGITPAALPPPGQPDISYHPDWDKYQARVARRTQTDDLTKSLPEGFPKELKGDLVWDGETLAQKRPSPFQRYMASCAVYLVNYTSATASLSLEV
ncbi:hypothetical protein LB505_009528 [Fusarium chuoi]|nr:hypothetical protein LB505_009528 [Fusarium chuoi]